LLPLNPSGALYVDANECKGGWATDSEFRSITPPNGGRHSNRGEREAGSATASISITIQVSNAWDQRLRRRAAGVFSHEGPLRKPPGLRPPFYESK